MIHKSRLKVQLPTKQHISNIQSGIYGAFEFLSQQGIDKEHPVLIYAHYTIIDVVIKAVKQMKCKRIYKVLPDFPTLIYSEMSPDTPPEIKQLLKNIYNTVINPMYRKKRKLVYKVLYDVYNGLQKKDPEIAKWLLDFIEWYRFKYKKTFAGAGDMHLALIIQKSKVIGVRK